MKMKPVDSIPNIKRCAKHPLQEFIADFMDLDARIVMVEYGPNDYKSAKVAVESLRLAVKRSGYPVKVAKRDERIFLMKI